MHAVSLPEPAITSRQLWFWRMVLFGLPLSTLFLQGWLILDAGRVGWRILGPPLVRLAEGANERLSAQDYAQEQAQMAPEKVPPGGQAQGAKEHVQGRADCEKHAWGHDRPPMLPPALPGGN